MAEKRSSEIPRNLRELYEKGNQALAKKNYDYAIAIYNQVLQDEPGFYEAREALRATQFHKLGTGGGFFKKVFGSASSSPQLAKAQFMVRNNPREAILNCEQVLNGDPANGMAHKLLAEAAMASDLPKTAVLSLEIVFKNNSKDQDVVLRLAEALAAAGNISRAESLLSDLQRANPGKTEISQALKNISAKRTMHEGGYNEVTSGEGSYRDLLKDKKQAASLEQEQRQVKSEDVAGQLIAEQEARLEKEPENLRLIRSIAELYAQKKDYDRALEYLGRITTTGGDPTLEKAIADTKVKKLEHELAQLDPSDPATVEKKAALEKEKQEFQIAEARRQVEKYPNDLSFRHELGVLYFKAGKIGEAIQEFQKAQTNPHKKIQSLYYLGRCFAGRGMNDLAVRTFQNALKEKPVFDQEKKELVYWLGVVLEKMGKPEEAIEQFKQIYEVDIGFRDVAKRVDDYYSSAG